MNTELTNRQQEIIEVSLKLIAENGIQGFTIKNLAQKMGFTEAAVYRHYENKVQIFVAILDFFKQNFESFFTNQIQSKSTALNKIEQLFLNHFKIFTQNPSIVAVIFSEEVFRSEVILLQKFTEIMNANSEILIKMIKEGQENKEIRDDILPTNLAIMVMGSLRLYVKQWQMSNYSFDLNIKGLEIISSIKLLIKIN